MARTLPQTPDEQGARRVLIVDDDHDLAESLAEILVRRDYVVKTAHSAGEAEEINRRFDVQVALLDIRLGSDNGLHVIGILKQQNPEVICVMLTAHAEMDTAIDAMRRGAYDYLRKPLQPNEVLAALERCFDKSRLEQKAKAAYEALRTAKEAAESADRAKTHFLAAMSHELRTPLHSIIGFSEVLMSQALGDLGNEKYVEYAGDIRDSGLHLLGIINDLLDIAKAEAGKLELREGGIDLSDSIAATLRLMKPQAETAEVELVTEIAPELPAMRGDEQKLKQILLNLVSNAVKFTRQGGRAKIAAGYDPDGGIVIRVEDTGIGIAEDDIPKALTPFSQVDSDLSRGYQGTGLGLSLSAAMVAMHGGTLTLDSEVGVGTTVTVRFPAERSIVKTHAA